MPVDQIATFIESMTSAAARIAPMAITYGFGHVGDGNIHLWVLPVSDDAIEPFLAVRDEMTAEADRLVFALGGTLSAEHGVGRLLRERVGPQKPAIEWALMRSIKQALDPDDLFNPGALPPPE